MKWARPSEGDSPPGGDGASLLGSMAGDVEMKCAGKASVMIVDLATAESETAAALFDLESER